MKKTLIKDIVVLMLLLHEGSFLLYTNLPTIEAALRRHKRWSKLPLEDLRDLLSQVSGSSLGKWRINIRSPYIFLE